MTRDTRLRVELSAEEREALDRLSKELNMSVSNLVRQILRQATGLPSLYQAKEKGKSHGV